MREMKLFSFRLLRYNPYVIKLIHMPFISRLLYAINITDNFSLNRFIIRLITSCPYQLQFALAPCSMIFVRESFRLSFPDFVTVSENGYGYDNIVSVF